MKKLFNKIIAVTITLALLMSSIGTISVFAEKTAEITSKNADVNIRVSVQERNGIYVKDFFFRRGIALEEGLIYEPEEICVTENGNIIPSAAEASERYEDGSIRWLLVSAKMDLKPNEFKILTVTNGVYKNNTVVEKKTGSVKVKTGKLSVSAAIDGITSIVWNGKEMLNGNSINLYATIDGKTYYMKSAEVSLLKDTASYKKIKLKGFLTDGLEGEMYVTIADNTSGIHIEHRHHYYEQITVQSMGVVVGAKYSGAEVGKVINEDYLDLGEMQLSSIENTRFNNAVCDPTLTGYVIEEDRVLFAPLVHNSSFKWADGASRTAHLHINFENSAKDHRETLWLPPNVKVDAEQYKKAGQIKSTEQSVIFRQAIDMVGYSYSKSIRALQAGSLCQGPTTGPFVSAGGDIEYNLGMGYMISGDEEVFRHMHDQSETRADLAVYKGNRPELIGCVRAQLFVNFSNSSAFHNHGYYSDEGGMYMTYMLSGDEYIGEMFELAVEKTLKDMHLKKGNGGRGPVVRYWTNRATDPNGNTSTADFMEARGMIRARTMYLASRYFHDDRYRQAAFDMVDWAITCQEPFGGFNQVYWNNGQDYYLGQRDGSGEPFRPFKDYTMLYGFRGINQLLDWEYDEETLALVCRVADYFCSHCERFGPLLMQPNSDVELCERDEDGGRKISSISTVLALDIVCTAYEHTGNERYLKTICAFAEELFCTSVRGWAVIGATKGYASGKAGPDGQRSVSILRTADDLAIIFKENRDKLKEMGYESIYIAYAEDAEVATNPKLNAELGVITYNTYESSEGKIFFLCNTSSDQKSMTEGWERTVEARFDENKLWQGVPNVVDTNAAVTLEKYLEHKGRIIAIQRPVSVEEIEGKATINIDTYTEEEVALTLTGDFEAALEIRNGIFPIDDNTGYSVDVKSLENGVKLTVKPGGEEKPSGGVLTVKLNGNGQRIDTVGTRVLASYGLDKVDANAPLSGEQLSQIIKQSFNQDVTFSEAYPTWNSFATEFTGAAAATDSNFFDEVGLITVVDGVDDKKVSDADAVKFAAEALGVAFEGEGLASDVYLAKKGLYNTDIKWESSREDILTSDGVITRRNIDCANLTLTATVTRGEASYKKEFVIPLEKPVSPPMVSSMSFDDATKTALVPQTGTCEFSFDVQSNRDYTDTIIFLSSSKTPVTALAEQPYLVRFAPKKPVSTDDYYPIDSRNGASFYAENPVYYKAGAKFHIRMVVHLDEQTYDVYVTPEGGEEVVIGKNMKPRATAPVIHEIDQINIWGSYADALTITNIEHADYAKEASVNVMLSDDAGNLYDPYASLDNFVLPMVSENGKLINWQTVNSGVRKHGMSVRVRLGTLSKAFKEQNVTDIMREVRMIESGIDGKDCVTASSLTRILSVINKE